MLTFTPLREMELLGDFTITVLYIVVLAKLHRTKNDRKIDLEFRFDNLY